MIRLFGVSSRPYLTIEDVNRFDLLLSCLIIFVFVFMFTPPSLLLAAMSSFFFFFLFI